MPDPITCPACHDAMETPEAHVGPVAVCPSCGASLVIAEDAPVRIATGADTTALSPDALQTLRAARARVRRRDRRSA